MTAVARPAIRIEAPPLRYEPVLDSVRALAVMVVMAFHFGAQQWFPSGFYGVDWFFVLSGFLITNLLLDEQNREDGISLRGFYHRRILRLFPAMYAFLGFVLLVSPILSREGYEGIYSQVIAAALYSYQLLIGFFGFGSEDSPRILLHLWTLSVEEWFYFIWPVALIWGISRARSQRVLLWACGAFIAFWMGVRLSAGFAGIDMSRDFVDSDPYPYWLKVLWRFSVMRFDVLVMGCLLAILRRRMFPFTEKMRRRLDGAAAVGIVLAAVFLLGAGRVPGFLPWTSVGYNLSLFGVAAVVLWLHFNGTSAVSRALANPFLVWVGKRSYGLYLWHEVAAALVPTFGVGKAAWLVRAVPLFLVSFGLAELSWRVVESPFLRRKNRRYRSLTSP